MSDAAPPPWVRRLSIPSGEWRCLVGLCGFAPYGARGSFDVWPSRAKLAEETGQKPATVADQLRKLAGRGLIERLPNGVIRVVGPSLESSEASPGSSATAVVTPATAVTHPATAVVDPRRPGSPHNFQGTSNTFQDLAAAHTREEPAHHDRRDQANDHRPPRPIADDPRAARGGPSRGGAQGRQGEAAPDDHGRPAAHLSHPGDGLTHEHDTRDRRSEATAATPRTNGATEAPRGDCEHRRPMADAARATGDGDGQRPRGAQARRQGHHGGQSDGDGERTAARNAAAEQAERDRLARIAQRRERGHGRVEDARAFEAAVCQAAPSWSRRMQDRPSWRQAMHAARESMRLTPEQGARIATTWEAEAEGGLSPGQPDLDSIWSRWSETVDWRRKAAGLGEVVKFAPLPGGAVVDTTPHWMRKSGGAA